MQTNRNCSSMLCDSQLYLYTCTRRLSICRV
ncbi:hypothetical protein LINPERPRIM_LOCUS29765 [Linum perenne]